MAPKIALFIIQHNRSISTCHSSRTQSTHTHTICFVHHFENAGDMRHEAHHFIRNYRISICCFFLWLSCWLENWLVSVIPLLMCSFCFCNFFFSTELVQSTLTLIFGISSNMTRTIHKMSGPCKTFFFGTKTNYIASIRIHVDQRRNEKKKRTCSFPVISAQQFSSFLMRSPRKSLSCWANIFICTQMLISTHDTHRKDGIIPIRCWQIIISKPNKMVSVAPCNFAFFFIFSCKPSIHRNEITILILPFNLAIIFEP